MASKEQVVSVLRATLLSCKGAVSLKQCNRDYRELEGEYIPYAKLGYSSLETFITDIPGIKLYKDSYGEISVDAVASESTRHIAEMVSRQKSVSRKSAPRANYQPRVLRSDSWRKPGPPSSSYKSQFYKQYNPNKSHNNNSSYSQNYNQYSKPTQSYKTPEPTKKVNNVERSPATNATKTSPPARIPTKPKPAPAPTTSAAASARATTSEKKYSLTARLEAAVLADDSEPAVVPKSSRASSRLSHFRESLHSVEMIPLPLPAATEPVPTYSAQVELIRPRSPTPLPPDATSQDRLAWLCKKYNLSSPVYKINCIKEQKKGPSSYFCIVKIGNEYSTTTYPDSSGTEMAARELAAARLVLEVERRGGAGDTAAAEPVAPAAPALVLSRLAELVAHHHSGIWATTLPEQYREKFNEHLPSNWQDLVESSRQFNTDRGVNGQLMILPNNVENGSWQSEAAVLPWVAGGGAGDVAPVLELPELKLPDEPGWNVFITTVNCTIEVWLRLIGDQYSNAYHNLLNEMEEFYSSNGVLVSSVEVNSWYAVQLEEGWHRGLVVETRPEGALVFLGDHGDDELVRVDQLRLLAPRFATLPAQAILCRLDKMEELGANDSSVEIVRRQLVGQVLVAVPAAPSPAPAAPADHSVAVVLFRTFPDRDLELNVNDEILREVCAAGELHITERLVEVEVGCVSAEGQVWVVHPAGARLVRDALSLLTTPGPFHRPPPAVAPADAPSSNTLYMVQTLSGTWLRCSVRSGVAADGTVSTRLVDSGRTMRAPLASLLPLLTYSKVLALFPHQAHAVRLGAASRAAPAMVERLRELLLDTPVLCRALAPPTPASAPSAAAAREPDVELYVRQQGILATVNSTVLLEFEEQRTPSKPKEEPKDNPLEALTRKKERIFSRAASGGRLADSLPSSQLPPLELPRLNEWVNVMVTMAANPCNFVVQLTRQKDWKQLSEMMAQLQQHCPSEPAPPAPPPLPASGELYSLLYKDDSWYRVVVANVVSPEMVSVYFCDFGDLALVSAAELRRLPAAVPLARSLPPQAVKAKLYGVAPLHQDWSVEDCIRFQELTVNREFAALVRDIGADPLHPGDPLLAADLVDTSSSHDVYLNRQLHAECRARLTADQ